MDNILTQGLAAATIVKLLVDAFKLATNPHPWLPAALAILAGIGVTFLLALAGGGILTLQTSAQSVLSGIMAGATAMGVTGLHNAARKGNAEDDAAADQPTQRENPL